MSDDAPLPISLLNRIDLYEMEAALRREGLTNHQIGESLGVSRDLVGYWLRGNRPKRVSKYEPDLRPSKDLAYVAGFYLGDGKDAGDEHKVRFGLADPEQLEYVGGLVAGLLGRAPKPLGMEGGFYVVQYDSVVLSEFLNHDIEWVVEYLKDFVSDFIRGFFDAEGYASCRVDLVAGRVPRMIVGAANTNLDYLDCVRRLLALRGIRPGLHRTNKAGQKMTIRGQTWIRKHDVYHLQISKNDEIMRFRKVIGFRNPTKADKLASLVRMIPMEPKERFVWFIARYARQGRRWLRKRKEA